VDQNTARGSVMPLTGRLAMTLTPPVMQTDLPIFG
jgi:hypothetical protein